jgi:multidrug efflux system membrane fusion protein
MELGTRRARNNSHRRTLARLSGAAGVAIAALNAAGLVYAFRRDDAVANVDPAPPPQVVASKPLIRDLDTSIGSLGQFSAVDQVKLRAQVGGTLTEIHFKDGDVVHKGDLLFAIDARPYEIRLAQANALLVQATAKLALAQRELDRAQALKRSDAGTVENVDQRTADLHTDQAAVEDAKAQIVSLGTVRTALAARTGVSVREAVTNQEFTETFAAAIAWTASNPDLAHTFISLFADVSSVHDRAGSGFE